MKKSHLLAAAVFAVALVLLLILSGAFYTVDQTEQVIITQFGQPVGDPITEPGLHFKIPFVQSVNSLDKRFLEWDGAPVAIPTRDKTYIHVNTFARWRIEDPKLYFVRLHDERSAQSRLEDILGSETRNSIAKHDLIEIVRTDKNRQPLRDETLKGGPTGAIGVLPPIEFGRLKIEEEIKAAATQKLAEFGIAVLDFRIKRVNYNPDVLDRIYQRMISERLQIAQRFRSEGEGQSARIAGQRERDLNEISPTLTAECRRSAARLTPRRRRFTPVPIRKIRKPPSSTPSSRPWRLITKSSAKIPPWCSPRTATYLPC